MLQKQKLGFFSDATQAKVLEYFLLLTLGRKNIFNTEILLTKVISSYGPLISEKNEPFKMLTQDRSEGDLTSI